MADHQACSGCGRKTGTTMTIESAGQKPTPPLCTGCFQKRVAQNIRNGIRKGNGMAKTTATIDKTTGEVTEHAPMYMRELETKIAGAYGDLLEKKQAKDDATAEHKKAQEYLNSLVAELSRIVNGEQPLPLK